jgi:hypothetical protein
MRMLTHVIGFVGRTAIEEATRIAAGLGGGNSDKG